MPGGVRSGSRRAGAQGAPVISILPGNENERAGSGFHSRPGEGRGRLLRERSPWALWLRRETPVLLASFRRRWTASPAAWPWFQGDEGGILKDLGSRGHPGSWARDDRPTLLGPCASPQDGRGPALLLACPPCLPLEVSSLSWACLLAKARPPGPRAPPSELVWCSSLGVESSTNSCRAVWQDLAKLEMHSPFTHQSHKWKFTQQIGGRTVTLEYSS